MSKRLVVSIVAVLAVGMFSARPRAQDDKWNKIPPKRAAYAGKKPSGPAPRRDLTGIWDAAQTLGVSGATEHPALLAGGRGAAAPGAGHGGHVDSVPVAASEAVVVVSAAGSGAPV